MKQTIIQTNRAPQAIGPYVQARKAGPFLFTSGQIALDPASGKIAASDIKRQTRLVLKNLAAVVEAGGGSIEDIVKTTVFIKDMNDFGTINAIYADFFGEHKPARSCIEAARLPKDVLIEIECVALIPE